MYRNILIPVALDHEHDIGEALGVADRLLAGGGKITALHVVESVPAYAAQYLPEGHMERRIEESRAALEALLGARTDVATEVTVGHAGRTIVDWAEEHGVDLIVIASHRPGLQDYFLGSTAARVVRHTASAVHVLR
ncbi:Nucleotide-binding universal stress protein, UspA family [Meinhardsimonia xiamenensis]|jgi:nucleotide-binding universal stress UspA family protein|uniref:Nucleotide-binding universal stress protein, UspA family n=1 Tax=Meinhardsimonia xiamenensis TaxID=990712 RepID=A0A1G8ZCJ5_9RHOB|nr:universal stress protein [Meinhardsimonia xiamenensis]PRX37633.1 nucleotide-binding universal stress UspA family protein [Meinhardsimonia xiamenensis]SDK12374.1 Nucleotide-binding universal stress protein, UspA family [Meinhardsimonia xiamenensis]